MLFLPPAFHTFIPPNFCHGHCLASVAKPIGCAWAWVMNFQNHEPINLLPWEVACVRYLLEWWKTESTVKDHCIPGFCSQLMTFLVCNLSISRNLKIAVNITITFHLKHANTQGNSWLLKQSQHGRGSAITAQFLWKSDVYVVITLESCRHCCADWCTFIS